MKLEHGTRRWLVRDFVLPLALFTAVTLFILYPMSLHPASLVRGRPFEDAFESIWFLHWYKEALFDLGVSPFFQSDIFYPLGWDLRFAILPPLHPILLAPLTALLGHVLAYNLTVLATCIFAAYGAYLLARALDLPAWAAILAGVAYAFYPERQVSFDGHLNFLLASLWVPWMLYGLLRAYQQEQRRIWWMAFAGLCYSLSVTAAWPFAIMTSSALAVFGLVLLARPIWRNPRQWLKPLLAAALVVLVVAGPWIWQGYHVRRDIGAAAEFPFEGINRSSVSLERFVVPNFLNPPLWSAFENAFPQIATADTSIVNFGYVVLLLAIAALFRLRPRKRPLRRPVAALLAMTGLSLLLMLGPTLHFMGQPISIQWPSLAETLQPLTPELIGEAGALYVPMPSYLLYKVASPFRSFHGFDRWGMVAALGMGLLAGMGLTWLSRRYWKGSSIPAIIALLLLLAEFSPLPHTVTSTAEMQRSVDDWLAARPEQSVIIEYPLDHTMKGQSLYYTIAHGQKIVHGYSSILPAGYAELLPTLRRWPEPEALDLLESFGTEYILLNIYDSNRRFETEILPNLQAIDRLRLVQSFEDDAGPIRKIYVFELTTTQPTN
jgi:hypothetical protein